ncbi:MAG: DinB family protein [Ktedonobacterales bacterium]
MTTLPDHYADLAALVDADDPAAMRLVGQLDRALRARSAPPALRAALEQVLRQRIEALPAVTLTAPARTTTTFSRRQALKAAAASVAVLLTLGQTGPVMAAELIRLAQAQEGPMTGARLAGILQEERGRWNALLAEVGAERMEVAGVEGTWSVKELIAHLTWYERAIVDGARQVLSTGSFVRPGRPGEMLDERNARIAAEARSRSAGDVLAEAQQVFVQLLGMVAACPEDLLNDPQCLALPGDVLPWMRVANNSYAHYREHEQAIRAWLQRLERDGVE